MAALLLVAEGLTGPTLPGKLNRGAALQAFMDGKAAMVNAPLSLMRQIEDSTLSVPYGTVALPSRTGRTVPTMGTADWTIAFRSAGHREATGKFLDFLYGDKYVTQQAAEYQLLPVTTAASAAMRQDKQYSKLWNGLDALGNMELYPSPRPTGPRWWPRSGQRSAGRWLRAGIRRRCCRRSGRRPARPPDQGQPPRQVDLGADRLAGRLPVQHLPPIGECLDEYEAPAAFVEGTGGRYVTGSRRTRPTARVGDLDADAARDERQPQLEVPAGYAPVRDRVGGQLGDDHGDGVGGVRAVRDAPGVQLVQGEVTCEAGAARGGAESLREHTYGNRVLGGGWCGHGPNLAVITATSPGRRRVRCGSVRGDGLDSTGHWA